MIYGKNAFFFWSSAGLPRNTNRVYNFFRVTDNILLNTMFRSIIETLVLVSLYRLAFYMSYNYYAI